MIRATEDGTRFYEFVRMVSKRNALYYTNNGYKIRKLMAPPVSLNKDEKALYYRYQYSATARGIEFELSTDSFKRLIHSNCLICGVSPSQIQGNTLYNGIDRQDNSKGYEIENVAACCGTCNRMKGTLSMDELGDHMMRIYQYLKPIEDAREIADRTNLSEDHQKLNDVIEQKLLASGLMFAISKQANRSKR